MRERELNISNTEMMMELPRKMELESRQEQYLNNEQVDFVLEQMKLHEWAEVRDELVAGCREIVTAD